MKSESIRTGEYTFSYTYHRGRKPLTIVLIHGLGGSKEYLQGVFNYPSLAECSILIPDLVGFGETPAPAGFSYEMEDQAHAVKRLMDALGIKGDVVLIPHSMGGPIGIILAELLGPRVKGIVYAEGNIDFGDCFSSNLVITKYTYDEYLKTGFEKGLESMRKRGEYPGIIASQQKAGPVTLYRSSQDLVKVSKEDTLAGRLTAFKVPILAVYGEKNRGLWTSEKKLGALFSLVFIPDAGHMMMGDNPDAFYGEVAKFIKELK